MRKKGILITGAAGEIGDALIHSLAEQGEESIVTLDLRPLSIENSKLVTHIQGDLMDHALLARLVSEYEIATIYHLAALLSTGRIHSGNGAPGQCRGHIDFAQTGFRAVAMAQGASFIFVSQLNCPVWDAQPAD